MKNRTRRGAARLLDRARPRPHAAWYTSAGEIFAAIVSTQDANRPVPQSMLSALADIAEGVPAELMAAPKAAMAAERARAASADEAEQIAIDALWELQAEMGAARAENRQPNSEPLELFAGVFLAWMHRLSGAEMPA